MRGAAAVPEVPESVIWHDAECGAYVADLALWSGLAGDAGGPIADLGCGTGRVALHLGRLGHSVTAVDSDESLVAELRHRAGVADLPVIAQVGDVRRLDLEESFPLILAPMQLVQVLVDEGERAALLRGISRSLSPGGLAALALVGEPPESDGIAAPLPDVREVGGWIYSSLPLGVRVDDGQIEISRLRQVVSPAGEMTESTDLTCLALVSPEELEKEGERHGLRRADRREIPATEDHVGSTVVTLEKA